MKPLHSALYRLLLHCYPAAFRRTYGDDMERMFQRMLARERGSRGFIGAWSVWLGAAEDALRSGLAERRAVRRLDARRGGIMHGLGPDLRQAVRSFASRPGFALTAVLVIALGIGANSAIFSLVNGAILRPLPYRDPDRLVLLWQTWAPLGLDQVPWALHDFIDTREQTTQLSDVALFRSGSRVLNDHESRRLRAAVVSPGLFPLLGVDPMMGRVFAADEELPANRDRVILTHRTWLEVFGGDPAIVGSKVILDDRPHTIVGVMPSRFAFPPPLTYDQQMLAMDPDIFVPFALFPEPRDGNHSHFVIARLAPGATRASANAELTAIHANLAAAYPVNEGVGAYTVPLRAQSTTTFRTSLLLLLAAAGCVLLVACTSIANLLTSRAIARQREFALRAALGARRSRLVRQLLLESVSLGVVSGVLGLALGQWIVAGVTSLNPMGLPDILGARLDWRVVAFTFAASLVATITFGLLPAVQASRPDLASAFHGGLRLTRSRSELRVKSVLIVGQAAMAVFLLVFAGLAVRSFTLLWDVDPGFDARPLLTFHVDLPESRYGASSDQKRFTEQLIQDLAALPGSESAAAATRLPFVFDQNSTNYFVEGEPRLPNQGAQVIDRTLITPAYFETMGARMASGRPLSVSDTGAVPVGVVNEAIVRRHWPDGNWSGRRLAFDRIPDDGRGWIQIVGVVADIRAAGLSAPAEPMIYLPLAQQPQASFFVLMRTGADPSGSIPPARAVLNNLDPAIPMDNVKLMGARKAESVRKPRFLAMLLAGFGVLSLVIATIGIYGVMAFEAARRTREIGIRIALGARPASVRSLITRRGLWLTSVGLVIGLVAAVAASRAVEGTLYGVSSTDPSTLAAAGATLLAAGWLATWFPARRATKVDPMVALRAE